MGRQIRGEVDGSRGRARGGWPAVRTCWRRVAKLVQCDDYEISSKTSSQCAQSRDSREIEWSFRLVMPNATHCPQQTDLMADV